MASDRTGRCRGTWAAWGVVGLLVALAAGLARAGDAELAKFLLKAGKESLQKGKADDALTKLRKSLDEDDGLLEAHYWIGVAFEKLGDPRPALDAYREFRAAVVAKGSGATKEEQALLKKTEARLATLAAGEADLERARSAAVAELLAFGRSNAGKDRSVAVRALRAVLALEPGHAEAQRLLASMGATTEAAPAPTAPPTKTGGEQGGDEAEPPAGGPFQRVRDWKDLLTRSVFGVNEGWSWEEPGLVIDLKGGSITRPRSGERTGSKFALEMEARVVEGHGNWCIGPAFGADGKETVMVFFRKTSVILTTTAGSSQEDLGSLDYPPLEDGSWHRLGVLVDGNRIEVWFDGKKAVEAVHKGRDELDGEVGIFHQDCRVEIRKFRQGRLP